MLEKIADVYCFCMEVFFNLYFWVKVEGDSQIEDCLDWLISSPLFYYLKNSKNYDIHTPTNTRPS